MVFSPPTGSFSSFTESFDGHGRSRERRPGWFSLASLGRRQHYDPNQPRVPAGHHDGGQWTRVASSTTRAEINDTRGRRQWTRIAASEPPGLGWRSLARTALMEVLAVLIRDHRNENADPDLFGQRKDLEGGAVASAILDGKELIGVNRYFPSYTTDDYRVAIQLRRYLLNRYPGIMDTKNIGRILTMPSFMLKQLCCCERHKRTAERWLARL